MRTVTIEVSNLRKSLGRFRRAWKKREQQGEFISFDSLETLLKTLTVKRWELLHVLQDKGPLSIRALARVLERDVKNVHADVKTLLGVGLIKQQGRQVRVPFDEIKAEFVVRKAAA
jgi:predicted transcriptional regulator